MKKMFKKAIACVTAAAIATASMAITSFAAILNENGEGSFSFNVKVNLPDGYALTDVYGGRFTISIDDMSGGVGGAFAFNSDELGWQSKGWGNAGQDLTMSEEDFSVEYLGDVALFTDADEYASIDVQQWWGADFTVTSVEALDIDGNTICSYEYNAFDGIVAYEGSYDITITEDDNAWWAQRDIPSADILGGVDAKSVVGISFESNKQFCIGYDSISVGDWVNTSTARSANIAGSEVSLTEWNNVALIGSCGDSLTITWKVYVLEKLPANYVDEENNSYKVGTGHIYDINLYSVGTNNPADITSVIFNVTMVESNWGWGNAQLYTNGNVSGWLQTSIGGSAATPNVTLEAGVSTDVEMEMTTDGWFELGVNGVYGGGAFTINTVTFMAGEEVYYVMEELPVAEALAGNTATLEDGKIGLNYFMNFGDDVLADDDASMSFTYADGTVVYVPVSEGVATDNGYKFAAEVNAKEMGDSICAQLVLGDGTTGKQYWLSVKDYATSILEAEAGTYSDETIALVNAMLVYGGYAQTYFGHNADKLVSDGLDTDVSKAFIKFNTKDVTGALPEGVEFYGTTLLLKGTTIIRHYFTATDASVLPEGYVQSGDYYYYDITGNYADMFDTKSDLVVGDWTISYSVNCYIQYVIDNSASYDEDLVNLVKALLLYGNAADTYVTG